VLSAADCGCLVVERDADPQMLARYHDLGCKTLVAGETE
jgi:hypothetical protein